MSATTTQRWPQRTTTVSLPTVSVGGYGAIVRALPPQEQGARYLAHCERVEKLKRELAAELQRADIAYAAMTEAGA